MLPRTAFVPRALLIASLALGLAACQRSTNAPDPTNAGKKRALLPQQKLYMGTKETRQEINELLARVPAAGAAERASIQQRLPRYGEPAVAPLAQALSHPTPAVRMTSAYALGQIKDPRALEPLAGRLGDPDEAVRFEVATAMLRMDDHRGVDTLLYGLEHTDPRVRAMSILVLQERTGQRKGYKADDPPVDRAAAVARWRAWAQNQRHGW